VSLLVLAGCAGNAPVAEKKAKKRRFLTLKVDPATAGKVIGQGGVHG
jgi:predicted RNA-binding protein YlqC (UPF0109 family)